MPYTFVEAKVNAEEVGGSCDWQYDQSLDIRVIVGGKSVNKGWCHALSVMWIKKGFAGENFLEWFGPAEKACPQRVGKSATVGPVFNLLKQMMDEQSRVIDNYNAQGNKQWWAVDYALVRNVAQYGLTPGGDGLNSMQIEKNAELMVDLIGTIAGYNYLGLDSPNKANGGAHAMGCYVTANRSLYVFFDPNFGQFRFSSATMFRDFLKKFMPRSGYGRRYSRLGVLNISASN
ncbi:YopT-type cysteine protease domain-containing protein [Falsiroseomonas oryzae]|uniref:YopT-type cysteine protease domain-containing protein n=1 Tax=Falsiroseomonas oryzae TaxID=2766473 RepID=UPI0022EB84BB|nr:YopT-type cysteine protease domain-containing protein [Roseomonas sp. MO-31]